MWMAVLLVLCPCLVRSANPPLRVALVQATLAWGDVDANLTAFDHRIEQCGSCDVIVFPELFASGCEMKKTGRAEALQRKDEVAARYDSIRNVMGVWARRTGALVVGSTIYKEGGKYYNRLLAAFPDGTVLHYDKHNCFKKGSFSPGSEQLVLEWKGWRLSTFICYDLRFPEWSRNTDTYDAALYIANWPASRADDWLRLLKERAVENKAYVIGVNCVGTDPAGLTYQGGSCVVSPAGKTVASCTDFQEDIRRVEISKR